MYQLIQRGNRLIIRMYDDNAKQQTYVDHDFDVHGACELLRGLRAKLRGMEDEMTPQEIAILRKCE